LLPAYSNSFAAGLKWCLWLWATEPNILKSIPFLRKEAARTAIFFGFSPKTPILLIGQKCSYRHWLSDGIRDICVPLVKEGREEKHILSFYLQ